MRIVVLGAGVAGMCGALKIKEKLGDLCEVTILEVNNQPGGLLTSSSKDRFHWDNGSFIFQDRNYLTKILPEIFEPVEDFGEMVWMNNKFYPFPFSFKNLLSLLSFKNFLSAGLKYTSSNIKRYLNIGFKDSNLNDWISNRITSNLMKSSKLDVYLTKLQGREPNQLSLTLGTSRLKYIDIMSKPKRVLQMIKPNLKKVQDAPQKNASILYPKAEGVGFITKKLATLCQQNGIEIIYNANIKEITDIDTVKQYKLDFEVDHKLNSIHAQYLLTTIPLDKFVQLYNSSSKKCVNNAQKLKYIDMQLAFFVVKKPIIMHKTFSLYSYERHHPWKRLFARSNGNGLTTILVEATYDPENKKPIDEIEKIILNQLTNELKLFEVNELITSYSTKVQKAYPIYELGFEKHTKQILDELECETLQFAGRQGRFLYVNSDRAIQTALKAANNICSSLFLTLEKTRNKQSS